MKTNFNLKYLPILLLGAVCVLFSSCGDDDDDDEVVGSSDSARLKVTLYDTSIKLKVGETRKLSYTGYKPIWTSDNNYIASVSDGTVKAQRVGTTTVYANSHECQVVVEPKNTLFAEPYLNWEASMEDIKTYMAPYDLINETSHALVYQGEGYVLGYQYVFDDDVLSRAILGVNPSDEELLSEFLAERYILAGSTSGNYDDGSGQYWLTYYASVNIDMEIDVVLSRFEDESEGENESEGERYTLTVQYYPWNWGRSFTGNAEKRVIDFME